MLFEQHQEIQTPIIGNNGGSSIANPLLSSLDFLLLDDIEFYLPSVHSKKNKNECLFNNKNECPIENNNNEHEVNNGSYDQQHQELFSDLDLTNFAEFEEKSQFIDNQIAIDEFDLEKWISQSAFPSPPMEIGLSPNTENIEEMNNTEDSTSSSSTMPWVGEECTIQSSITDMSVPLSPPLSIASSSPAPTAMKKSSKRSGLTIMERKLRKKDQNKTAAEKYRIRKKSEKNTVASRHDKLKLTNRDLKLEAENLSFRIQQLKQLFVDVLQIQLPSTIESS